MKIYLAGPLFSSAERDYNARLAGLLREMKIEVWLPQESEQQGSMNPEQIFEEDVRGIIRLTWLLPIWMEPIRTLVPVGSAVTHTAKSRSLYFEPIFEWATRFAVTYIPLRSTIALLII
jgi:hypothetical protein